MLPRNVLNTFSTEFKVFELPHCLLVHSPDQESEIKEADILTKLRDIRFIPLVSTGKHCHVTECYLVGNTTPPHYQELFTYVNFTTGAAAFLKECGSQEIPSASEIANLLFTNPSAFYRELNYNQSVVHLYSRGHLTQNTVDCATCGNCVESHRS